MYHPNVCNRTTEKSMVLVCLKMETVCEEGEWILVSLSHEIVILLINKNKQL